MTVLPFYQRAPHRFETYLFPVLAKFTGSLYDTFKNAMLMSVRHLPMTLLTVIWATVWLMLAALSPFSGLMLIAGAGLIAWIRPTSIFKGTLI